MEANSYSFSSLPLLLLPLLFFYFFPMEANSWRSAQAMDSAGAVDWRSQLQPEERQRIVNRILEYLQRHVFICVVPAGLLNELQKNVVRLEEKIYSVATSRQDYIRKISLKILSMEAKAQHITPINPAIPNSGVVNQTSSDSANKWRSAHGDGPAMDSAGAVDWRSQFQPEARQRIVNRILEYLQRHPRMENLKRHVSTSTPEVLNELKKVVVRLEEKIYSVATSQQDYLRKISSKIRSMETKAQHTTPINPAIPNSGVVNQTSSDSGLDSRMVRETGYSYRLRKLVRSRESVGDNFCHRRTKANPGEKVFRTKYLSNYEALSRIKLSTATGLLSRASTQRPLDPEGKRTVDDESANPGMSTRSHPILCNDLVDNDNAATQGLRRKGNDNSSNRPTKSPKTSKIDKCMDAITSASNAKTDKFIKAQAALEQFSMSKCMDVFRTMQNVPSNARLKALDVLANNAVYREAFLTMDEDFRSVWMTSLGSSD